MEQKTRNIDIPSQIVDIWQRIVDSISVLLSVPSVMINRLEPPDLEVFRSNISPSNPFPSGTRIPMLGLYCEAAAKKRHRVQVDDARKDPQWADSPTAKAGIFAYLGFPVFWPDGEVFGTICAVDTKENKWGKYYEGLLQTVKDALEAHLALLVTMDELNKRNQELELALSKVTILTKQLEKTTVSRDFMNNILSSMNESLLVVSPEGIIKSANAAIEKLLGFSENELIGQPIDIIFAESENSFIDHTIRNHSLIDLEKTLKTKNGTHIPVLFSSSIMYKEKAYSQGIICVATDITERKKTERQIQTTLKEKEVLLKEIHHRVKNNMQVIISLIKLQAGYTEDKKYQYVFEDIINRIHTMALVHLLLLNSESLSNINFQDYIEKLCEYLTNIYKVNINNIRIIYNIHIADLPIDTAISCGLIINELVSNSMKYAFTDTQNGRIVISLKELKDNNYELAVSDNGKGLPEDLNWRKTDSFGLKILSYMAEGQLEGKVKLNSKYGTKFIITFPR